MTVLDYKDLANIALEAGKRILEVYNAGFLVSEKSDSSPVTTADIEAHKIIVSSLAPTLLPVLSEEGNILPYEERVNWDEFWLVDPLDGTKEFVKRNGEFTVNIALIRNGVPTFGVVYAPVLKQMYLGGEKMGAYKVTISSDSQFTIDLLNENTRIPRVTPETFTVVASRSHLSKETEDFINGLRTENREVNLVSIGSSLKLCLVAEGAANIYPRLGPTMEWDTAAGHAICLAAGKRVYNLETNEDLTYNKQNLLNPYFVVE